MLEKDPDGLFSILFCSGIEHNNEIVVEKERKEKDPIIKVKITFGVIFNLEKSRNGPFIQMVPDSVKVFPKIFGYNMTICENYVVFR